MSKQSRVTGLETTAITSPPSTHSHKDAHLSSGLDVPDLHELVARSLTTRFPFGEKSTELTAAELEQMQLTAYVCPMVHTCAENRALAPQR